MSVAMQVVNRLRGWLSGLCWWLEDVGVKQLLAGLTGLAGSGRGAKIGVGQAEQKLGITQHARLKEGARTEYHGLHSFRCLIYDSRYTLSQTAVPALQSWMQSGLEAKQ